MRFFGFLILIDFYFGLLQILGFLYCLILVLICDLLLISSFCFRSDF